MSRKLKIIHTEASNGWGGQEIRIFNEAKWFRQRGHEVILIGPSEGQLLKRAREAAFKVHALPFAKNTQFKDFFALKNILKEEKPDVLGTHSSVDSWVGLLASTITKVPCRIRYRHISAPVSANLANRIQYNKLCDHIITTGECIRGPLIERLKVSPNRIDVVATGLVFPRDLPSKEDARQQIAQQLGLSEDSRFMGHVAVLRSWKGQLFVIEGFEKIADTFPQHHLIFAGEGPMRPLIEEKIAASPYKERIHLVGHQNDIWPYFRAFDAALLVSTQHEGIPQSGLQSLYAETPLIGTTVGGIPEIIEDGKNGLLIEPQNSAAIAEAMQRLLGDVDERTQMEKQTRISMQSDYNIDHMGNRVLGIIQNVLK